MDRLTRQLTAPWTLVGMTVIMTGVMLVVTRDPLPRYADATILLGILAFFIALTAHELGHMVGGTLVRFKFVTITIGPVMITKDGPRLRARLFNHWSRFLGFNLFLPPDAIRLRERLIVYIAGGPAASLLLILVTFAVVSTKQPTFADFLNNTPMWTALQLIHYTFMLSFGILILSMTPGVGLPTDGSKLIKLIPGDSRSDRWVAVTLVGFAILKGARPREWDSHWIDTLTLLGDRSADAAIANYLAYRWALDRKNVTQASQYLDRMIESRYRTAPSTRAGLLVEAAYFEMRYRHNLSRADEWLKQAGTRQRWAPKITRLRMGAAAGLMLNQPDTARRIALKALAMLNRGQDGISRGEQELFRDLLEQCQKVDKI